MMRFFAFSPFALSLLLGDPVSAATARTAQHEHKSKQRSLRGVNVESDLFTRSLSTATATKIAQIEHSTPTLLHTSCFSEDIARTGLDRSLSSIHTSSELNFVIEEKEALNTIVDFIAEYSNDGNDDESRINPFDYEGEEEYIAESTLFSRSLQMEGHGGSGGHAAHAYVESMCNMMVQMATCHPWSTYFNTTSADYLTNEVKIPCGECVTLDASPSQPLYGSVLEFGAGLNIVGKLVIPSDADIELLTKYVFVQGLLEMSAPPVGTVISSKESGDQVKITLYGTEDITFHADNATDNTHMGGKGVSMKAFVVAGGKIDVRAIDPTCPSWTKLQHVEYGTPLPNLALNKIATQSTTWAPANWVASRAVDGNDNSATHTNCDAFAPWWEVDLVDLFTIAGMKIVNRLDCCGRRLHDFDILFLDENKNEVGSIFSPGYFAHSKNFDVSFVNARYVKIQLRDTDCLQLGEVEVYGWPAYEPFPAASMDVLTVGQDAARCWSKDGSRLILTSDTYDWDDTNIAIVANSSLASEGKIEVFPMAFKKTAEDETFGYSDFAVEVALLDRSLVIQGTKDSGEFAVLGGHIIVLHTPGVHQHLEGALLWNMGQQGRLGRYPFHFHMSESVHGSTLAKNVIWESNQRCIVAHGSHNATVTENVAFDTLGHCFMLEDGGEWNNTFSYNLGAKTGPLPANTPRAGESDNRPSTFWITNPANHFFGNVAAGSHGMGFWFDLKLRAPASELEINHGVSPKHLALGTFENNTAHSNRERAGITTYEFGYLAPPGTIFRNIKSFKNRQAGVFQHGTRNIQFIGGLLADNGQAARNFHHDNAIYDGVEVIGRSEHVQSMIDSGRLAESCNHAGGISLQPNEGLTAGTIIKNSIFSGFDKCNVNSRNSPIWVENDQVRNAVFDSSPTLTNNVFIGEDEKRISACLSINNSPDGWVRNIAIEDDGSMKGVGFWLQNETAIMNFIDSSNCEPDNTSCLLFCPSACLRLGIVSISQDLTTQGFNMHIMDGATSATVVRGPIWFNERQNHLSAQMPLVLPAPTSGKYQISFTDKNDNPSWPGYAFLSMEREPVCSGGFTSEHIEFIMPSLDSRCDDLFHLDDHANGIDGWQHFFAGIHKTHDQGTGSYTIATTGRLGDGGHVNLSRPLDASCFKMLGGRTYHLFGRIRMFDNGNNGAYVETDGTSDASPKISVNIDGVLSTAWHVATSSDGSWTEVSKDITLPIDSSGATKATISISKAAGKEFEISDWGMILLDSEAPTGSPTTSQPTESPTDGPIYSPFPSPAPITAAPFPTVSTNLALNGFADADTECWNGWAYKAIDGNPSSINHSCCSNYGSWLRVDLGLNTLNYIESIVIKNRANCCGGRLRRFYVEVLDDNDNVVWDTFHGPNVGTGVVKTFTVNDGTVGRYVRVRYEDSLKDCLHVGELEVWGYPVELPAAPHHVYEMAISSGVATASSMYNSNNGASKAIDSSTSSIYHSTCRDIPWWMIDLGGESFVQDVLIWNRADCCGGRLRDTHVELLDSNMNVVESRYIKGSVGNGALVQKVFNQNISFGRYVRIRFSRTDCLQLAEVNVNGYHVE